MLIKKELIDLFPFSSYKKARFVILPVPYEETTSFITGTKAAPNKIIKVLKEQVETFDEELFLDASEKAGVALVSSLNLKQKSLSSITQKVKQIMENKKIPILLGGEHSISPYAVAGAVSVYDDLSVLQIDAHADLHDSYGGSKDSHACAGFKIMEHVTLVQVGVRAISQKEYDFAKKSGQLERIVFMNNYHISEMENILNKLSDNVYITIDVDAFDPSVVPAVGNPEPGGFLWNQMLRFLFEVSKNKNIVGFDVVELSPKPGLHASDMAVARLVYKLITYITAK